MNRQAAAVITLSFFSIQADAALLSRASGQAYYDDILNITWVADANLAQTTGYDADGGAMDWYTTQDWIASLNAANYLGASNWRLPQAVPVNGSSWNESSGVDGSTDNGFNISAPGSAYPGSTASEMAHLHYNTLGNPGEFDIYGDVSAECYEGPQCLINAGPFANIQELAYWSQAIPSLADPSVTWVFYFESGDQNGSPLYVFGGEGAQHFAWAVSPGDLLPQDAAVPIPAAVWLFGGALGALGLLKRRQRLVH